MLIRGSDAVVVKSVARSRGKLLVHTKPAKLTDVISSGKITFAGAPDFRKAVLIRNATASSKHAQTDFAPLADRHLGGPRASTASFPSLSSQGSVGPIGYSLTFSPSSSTRLDLSGTLCFASGSICANGPSNGLDAEVNLSGYLDFGSASGGIAVNGGRVTHSSLAISALNAHLKLTYHITRGQGTESNPPIVSIPVGVGISVPGPGAIPIYIRLQFLAAMSFGLVKGSVVNGGVEWSSTGSDTLIQSGNSLSASTTGGIANASILNQSNGGVPPSFAATASGTTITVREKLGIGLGTIAANGIAYVDATTTVGQAVGSAVVGMLCSSYESLISLGAGLEAQIGLGPFGLSIASPRKELFKRDFKTQDPGCPPLGS